MSSNTVNILDNYIFVDGANITNQEKYEPEAVPMSMKRLARATPEERAFAIESADAELEGLDAKPDFGKPEEYLHGFANMKELSCYINIYHPRLTSDSKVGAAMLQIADLAKINAEGWSDADVILDTRPENPDVVDDTRITFNIKPSTDRNSADRYVSKVCFALRLEQFRGLMTINYPHLTDRSGARLPKPNIKRYNIGPKKTTILSIRRPCPKSLYTSVKRLYCTKDLFSSLD